MSCSAAAAAFTWMSLPVVTVACTYSTKKYAGKRERQTKIGHPIYNKPQNRPCVKPMICIYSLYVCVRSKMGHAMAQGQRNQGQPEFTSSPLVHKKRYSLVPHWLRFLLFLQYYM